MRLWATWCKGRCLWPWQWGSWNDMTFKSLPAQINSLRLCPMELSLDSCSSQGWYLRAGVWHTQPSRKPSLLSPPLAPSSCAVHKIRSQWDKSTEMVQLLLCLQEGRICARDICSSSDSTWSIWPNGISVFPLITWKWHHLLSWCERMTPAYRVPLKIHMSRQR